MEVTTAPEEPQVTNAPATAEIVLRRLYLNFEALCPCHGPVLRMWLACHMPEPFNTFQEAGGKAATKAEPADGAAAETLALDNSIKDGLEGAPPPTSKCEEAKHGGKGEAADEKSEKDAEKAREKEKKKKFKVNEELLQAFRYFDRNCEYISPFVILH